MLHFAFRPPPAIRTLLTGNSSTGYPTLLICGSLFERANQLLTILVTK